MLGFLGAAARLRAGCLFAAERLSAVAVRGASRNFLAVAFFVGAFAVFTGSFFAAFFSFVDGKALGFTGAAFF